MKKVLLTAMTLASIATSSVFGMYGPNSDWIDFLTHGNQLRARMDQFGFTLGNGTIKGTFGFRGNNFILSSDKVTERNSDGTVKETKSFMNFMPTVSAGIGYTTEAFGIGVGYNYTYIHNKLQQAIPDGEGGFVPMTKNGLGLSVHTPVLAMNFLNNNLRIVVPMQVAVKNADYSGAEDFKYLGFSMDPQIRYYTGIPAFNEVRLTIKYGMNQSSYKIFEDKSETSTLSSFGFDFRAYFGAQVGDVGLKPFLKVTYDTSLDATKGYLAPGTRIGSIKDLYGITAGSGIGSYKLDEGEKSSYDSNPWELNIIPTLGLSANSDTINLYLEAGLGYKAVNTGMKFDKNDPVKNDPNKTGIQHSLAWNAYGEIYITPVKDLEWYFEASVGTERKENNGTIEFNNVNGISFAGTTGVTWYLPSLQ